MEEINFLSSVNCSNPENQTKVSYVSSLEEILKISFIICTRAENSSDFIERVLELEEK